MPPPADSNGELAFFRMLTDLLVIMSIKRTFILKILQNNDGKPWCCFSVFSVLDNKMLEFYYWEFSPPCRGVWMTLKQLGIKFDKRIIDLTKGEHKNEDFLNINPHGKVPAIRHDGFAIAER